MKKGILLVSASETPPHENHDTTTTATSFVLARSVKSISLKKCRKTRLVTVGPYKDNPTAEKKRRIRFLHGATNVDLLQLLAILAKCG